MFARSKAPTAGCSECLLTPEWPEAAEADMMPVL
jgi:hypothetical protein